MLIYGVIQYTRWAWQRNQTPFLTYYAFSLVGFLSLIKHKEPKFIMPIFPPFFLMIGLALTQGLKAYGRAIAFYLWLGIIFELIVHNHFVSFNRLSAYEVLNYLAAKDPTYTSLLVQNKFELSYYSYTHRHAQPLPRLLFTNQNPPFVKADDSTLPLPMFSGSDIIHAIDMMEQVKALEQAGSPLPDYAIVEEFPCSGELFCFSLFTQFIEQYYDLEKSFYYTN